MTFLEALATGKPMRRKPDPKRPCSGTWFLLRDESASWKTDYGEGLDNLHSHAGDSVFDRDDYLATDWEVAP